MGRGDSVVIRERVFQSGTPVPLCSGAGAQQQGWPGLEQEAATLFKTPTAERLPFMPRACAEKRAGIDATPL